MSKASEWAKRLHTAEGELDEAKAMQPRFDLWEPGALTVKAWLTSDGARMLMTTQRAGEALDKADGWINVERETALAIAAWIFATFADQRADA